MGDKLVHNRSDAKCWFLKHEWTCVTLARDIGFESRHSLLWFKTFKTIAQTKNMKNARPSIL